METNGIFIHECRYQTQPECDYYVIRNNIKYHHSNQIFFVLKNLVVTLRYPQVKKLQVQQTDLLRKI